MGSGSWYAQHCRVVSKCVVVIVSMCVVDLLFMQQTQHAALIRIQSSLDHHNKVLQHKLEHQGGPEGQFQIDKPQNQDLQIRNDSPIATTTAIEAKQGVSYISPQHTTLTTIHGDIDNKINLNVNMYTFNKQLQTDPCASATNATLQTLNYPYVCLLSATYFITYFGVDAFDMGTILRTPSLAVIVLYQGSLDSSGATTTIPEYVSQLSNSLSIWAASNAYSGTIPTTVGLLRRLTFLYWSQNILSGTMPSQIGKLTRLTQFHVGYNRLSGTIPSQLGNLQHCTHMDISSNLFTGQLPSQFGLLSSIQTLEVQRNILMQGTIPVELSALTTLTALVLYRSGFAGVVPTQLGVLTRLNIMTLNSNELTGPIPSEIFALTNLDSLTLSNNQFSGTLSRDITRLSKLNTLRLNYNQLTGPLPSQLGLLSRLSSFTLSNNQFRGSLPSQLLLLTNLHDLMLTSNTFDSPRLPAGFAATLAALNITLVCNDTGIYADTLCYPRKGGFISQSLVAGMSALAVVVWVALVVIGGVVVRHRSHPLIRTSGVGFSLVILAGLAVLLAVVPAVGISLMEVQSEMRSAACRVAAMCVSYGLVAIMTCITIRCYPIWRIFVNPRMIRFSIKPAFLMRGVVVALCANTALIVPMVQLIETSNQEQRCVIRGGVSHNGLIWVNVLFVVCLAVAATVINIKIRNVPSEFNETALIGRATYNTTTFGMCMVVVGFVTRSSVTRFLALSLAILLCVSLFVGLMFAPKVGLVLRGVHSSRPPALSTATSRMMVFVAPST